MEKRNKTLGAERYENIDSLYTNIIIIIIIIILWLLFFIIIGIHSYLLTGKSLFVDRKQGVIKI